MSIDYRVIYNGEVKKWDTKMRHYTIILITDKGREAFDFYRGMGLGEWCHDDILPDLLGSIAADKDYLESGEELDYKTGKAIELELAKIENLGIDLDDWRESDE